MTLMNTWGNRVGRGSREDTVERYGFVIPIGSTVNALVRLWANDDEAQLHHIEFKVTRDTTVRQACNLLDGAIMSVCHTFDLRWDANLGLDEVHNTTVRMYEFRLTS